MVNFIGKINQTPDKGPLKAFVTAIDVKTGEIFTFDESDECTGDYLIKLLVGKQYIVRAEVKGFIAQEQIVTIESRDDPENVQTLNLELQKMNIGATMVLENVFYDLNKATLADSSYAALDKVVTMLKENPTTRLEISAHTDSRGTDVFNQKIIQ